MGRRLSLLCATVTLLALSLVGCSSSGGGGGGSSSATVKGKVTDSGGAALSGVTVRAGAVSTTSGGDGSYSLSVGTGAGIKVLASKTGYVDTFEVLSLATGQQVPVDFALSAIGRSTALTSLLTTPATANDQRGSSVALGANTLVDSTGAPVDAATVSITTGLASDARYTSTFPGLFVGTKAGVDTSIESFGFVTINITSSAGRACNLATGATASIAIPVAPTADPMDATIDLWSLDPATGKWISAGMASRDDSGSPVVYRATVTHFSTYNLDRPVPPNLPLTVTVKNTAGALVAGASVLVNATEQPNGGLWEARGTTDANGVVVFPSIPPEPNDYADVYVVAGNQVGMGTAYTVANNAATMTVTLYTAVTRTFTVVYVKNGIQIPLPNQPVEVNQVTGNVGILATGTTNANGQVTLAMEDGHTSYIYGGHTGNIGGSFYALNATASTLAQVPATWVFH